MAVAAEVRRMRRNLEPKTRRCEFCASTGASSLMVPHRPLRDHYFCTGCGHTEIDWHPIERRVEAQILYEYPRAKARLAAMPAAPVTQYDKPYVDGGTSISQQEMAVTTNERDRWVVTLVEQLCRCGLTQEEKQVMFLRYFERWSFRQIAGRMHVAVSTVYERREAVLRQFARAAKWV